MRNGLRPRIAAAILTATALLAAGCTTSGSGFSSAGSAGSSGTATGKGSIVLSNSFVGNAWRQTMVADVAKQAAEAKSKGLIKSFQVVNSNNDVAQQISQFQSLILQKPSVILLLAASPTALNGAIQQACNAGIKVLAFDASVTADCAYKLKPDWVKFGEQTMESVAKKMNDTGNVVLVRGVSGSDVDLGMYEGWMNVLKKYPNMKKVGEVYGNWDDATTQDSVRSLLSTAPAVDGVMAYVSGYGVAQAFLAAGRKTPVIYGSNQGTFLTWWAQQSKATGYATESSMEGPAISEAALWLAVNMANGKKFDKNLVYPTFTITNDTVDKYAATTPRDGFADQHWDDESTLKQWPAK